jgi:hypothetical protein
MTLTDVLIITAFFGLALGAIAALHNHAAGLFDSDHRPKKRKERRSHGAPTISPRISEKTIV